MGNPATLVVFRIEGDDYVEVARAAGEDAHQATVPFDITLVPARLADL